MSCLSFHSNVIVILSAFSSVFTKSIIRNGKNTFYSFHTVYEKCIAAVQIYGSLACARSAAAAMLRIHSPSESCARDASADVNTSTCVRSTEVSYSGDLFHTLA